MSEIRFRSKIIATNIQIHCASIFPLATTKPQPFTHNQRQDSIIDQKQNDQNSQLFNHSNEGLDIEMKQSVIERKNSSPLRVKKFRDLLIQKNSNTEDRSQSTKIIHLAEPNNLKIAALKQNITRSHKFLKKSSARSNSQPIKKDIFSCQKLVKHDVGTIYQQIFLSLKKQLGSFGDQDQQFQKLIEQKKSQKTLYKNESLQEKIRSRFKKECEQEQKWSCSNSKNPEKLESLERENREVSLLTSIEWAKRRMDLNKNYTFKKGKRPMSGRVKEKEEESIEGWRTEREGDEVK